MCAFKMKTSENFNNQLCTYLKPLSRNNIDTIEQYAFEFHGE